MRSLLRRATPATRLHAGLAAVAYLPLLATRPGWISADTKTYLYLDPGQLLSRAPHMWDPSIGLGTVPHQRIGFLWPMAPFFWLADGAGLPDWVAQRLWWGSIIFAAGAGVAYLLRVLGWGSGPEADEARPGVVAAVFTYALSPVILTLIARLSGVLLPFAGLPWLVAFAVQAARHRGWRYPALFALAVATFGSVNATGLLLVGVAPVLWLGWAALGAREVSVRRALVAGAKIGLLTVAVSAWWIAGLDVQRTNGIDIIRYTETAKVVASASVSHEVWRGLGYWFFYGRDRLGPWIEPSYGYTQWPHLIAITYLVPILGLVGAALARWRDRAYFVLLIVVGIALAVGTYPWDANPPLGHLLQRFQTRDAGLAMRSLPRAVPLVALGTAVLLGAGVVALVRRWPRLTSPAAWGAVVLAVLALPPLWSGQFVPPNLRRHEDVPSYWRRAADHLDSRGSSTGVLVIPGSDFAAYKWGNTVDPVLPGLMDRPSVQRETIPNGSPASANLLDAFDLALQEGTASPAAVAAIARLMRTGDVLVVSDWQYERNSLPEPRRLWQLVSSADGLGTPTPFGSGDERRTQDRDMPPELAAFPVRDAVRIVAAQAADHPLLVAGDGAGLVDAAAAGLLDGHELVRYSANLSSAEIATALDQGAALLLTDSNRKRGERWNTLRHNRGLTETASGGPLATDLNDNRLPVFPGQGLDSQTVAVREGGISAEATSYGNAITYVPSDRPMLAVDGDPATAWRVAAFGDARGERLELRLPRSVRTDRVRLLQTDGDATRHITKARLRFDDGDSLDVVLGRGSQKSPGQTVRFPTRAFSRLSIEILGDSAGRVGSYAGHSGVGFREVEIGGRANVPADETVRLPTDLLTAAGTASKANPLAISLTRQRQVGGDRADLDDEPTLDRTFTLPGSRAFALSGNARLSGRATAAAIDDLLGRPHDDDHAWARRNREKREPLVSSAPLVFDGDAATAWESLEASGGHAEGQWVEVTLPREVTIDHLPLEVVTDDDHSLVTQVRVSVDGEKVATVDVPLPSGAGQGSPAGTASRVDLLLPPVTGSRFRVTVTEVEARVAEDAVYGDPIPPVGLAELGLPGPTVPAMPDRFDTGCRDDLFTVDGRPLALRVTGPMDDALAGKPLPVALCDASDAGVTLTGGQHRLASVDGALSGLDIDHLVLRSASGGRASTGKGPLATEAAATPAGRTPKVEVVSSDDTSTRVRVTGATPGQPFWLVLGESYNDGWEAKASGALVEGPELVDGFANGWLVTPSSSSFNVGLEFAPQRRVNTALWVSLTAALACLVLALLPAVRRAIVEPSLPAALDVRRALEFPGERPAVARRWLVSLGLGVIGTFVAGVGLGVVTATVAAVACHRRRARRWVVLGSPLALGAAAVFVCVVQVLDNPDPGLDWPFQMREAHPFGWLAALLVLVDVVVAATWRNVPNNITEPIGNQREARNVLSIGGQEKGSLVKTS